MTRQQDINPKKVMPIILAYKIIYTYCITYHHLFTYSQKHTHTQIEWGQSTRRPIANICTYIKYRIV